VACKQSNGLAADETIFFAAPGGYQNPPRFSARTYTYVTYHEQPGVDGAPCWTFVKRQCMHCTDLYCASVCAPQVFHRNELGVVVCEADKCIGCAACIGACPFGVPAIDYWDVATPHIRKCGFCLGRQQSEIDPARLNGKPLDEPALGRLRQSLQTPACAKACPTGAIQFGDRKQLLAEARRRIAAHPDKYVNHIYGEKEAGGTGWLYISGIPFEKLGFPTEFEPLDQSDTTRMIGQLGAGVTGGRDRI